MDNRLPVAIGAVSTDVEPIAAGRQATLLMISVDSAPLPDDVGVTLEDEKVSWPAPMVAAFREQSVNEPASTPSVTALPVAPHLVALALVVEV
jgi:hypothetical protein